MSWEVRQGDCVEVMRKLEAGSVDAVVTDPPAGIAFMGKDWDRDKGGRDAWIAWLTEAMAEALRVCKPGAHALVWAIPRTSHWTGFALEEAGWEIRDRIAHLFGTGFPKSRDLGGGVGTALKPAAEDWWLARKPFPGSTTACFLEHGTGGLNIDGCRIEGQPRATGTRSPDASAGSGHVYMGIGSDGAQQASYDENLPAGRWPANVVLSHTADCVQAGTGVVKGDPRKTGHGKRPGGFADVGTDIGGDEPNAPVYGDEVVARWECAPGCPVAALDAQSGERPGGGSIRNGKGMGYHGGDAVREREPMGDSGGASRFFLTVPTPTAQARFRYQSKTSRAERNAGLEGFTARALNWSNGEKSPGSFQAEGTDRSARNHHPTVKPINLMRWLVRLVTPPGGTCLDPFLGSGSTGCAAVLEGFDFIGIEREPEYLAIAEARIAFWAQHEGREVDEVLQLAGKSQRQAKVHQNYGQITVDDLLAEEAA